jgi:hypothetical protein
MRSLIVALLFFVITLNALAQQTYTGRVYSADTRLPLGGVVVKIDSISTTTNSYGYFQVNTTQGNKLIAELDGYESLNVVFPVETKFAFLLKPIESQIQHDLAASFYRYIGENIKYPLKARENAVHGLVEVYFEVDSLNHVTITEIIRPLKDGLSEEVIRVLKNAPRVWFDIKGTTKFVLPVRFRLGNSKMKDKPDTPAPGTILLSEVVVTAYTQ